MRAAAAGGGGVGGGRRLTHVQDVLYLIATIAVALLAKEAVRLAFAASGGAMTALAELVCAAAVMCLVCMVGASRKVHRGFSFEWLCFEAVLVFAGMLLGHLIGEVCLYWQAGLSIAQEDVGAWMEEFSVRIGPMLAVSAGWLLGSLPAWVDRPPWAPLAGLAAAFVLCIASLGGALVFGSGVLGVTLFGLVLALASWTPASCAQRLCRAIENAVRGNAKDPAGNRPVDGRVGSTLRKRGAHGFSESRSSRLRADRPPTGSTAFFLLCGASALTVVLFAALAGVAAAFGWRLRALAFNIALGVIAVALLYASLFLVRETWYVRPRATDALRKAIPCTIALLAAFVAIGAVQGRESSERVLPDGMLRIESPLFLGGMQVSYAQPVGPLFRIPLESYREPLPENEAVVEDEVDEETRAMLAQRQSGSSYHTSGRIVDIDVEAHSIVLEVTESTDDVERGSQVTVDCGYVRHADKALEELAVGESVQIRSVMARGVEGTIVAEKLFVQDPSLYEPEQGEPGAVGESVEQAFEETGCVYRVVGTVTSAVGDAPFSFRVDDGAGVLEEGATYRVAQRDDTRRLYGMKGLQWGMDGVVVGFAELPGDDGILYAGVIVGNDDTSSDYWENMPPA